MLPPYLTHWRRLPREFQNGNSFTPTLEAALRQIETGKTTPHPAPTVVIADGADWERMPSDQVRSEQERSEQERTQTPSGCSSRSGGSDIRQKSAQSAPSKCCRHISRIGVDCQEESKIQTERRSNERRCVLSHPDDSRQTDRIVRRTADPTRLADLQHYLHCKE